LGVNMGKWIGFGIGLMLSSAFASNAWASETIIAANVLGPEGPLVVNGQLYYVAWNPGSLSRWDGKVSTVINNAPGCSHNGLALTKQKTLLLACSDPHGAILELNLDGKELRRWEADDKGRRFDGGINDIVVAANGGAYATVFGPFAKTPTLIAGRLLYRPPGSKRWTQVADDINYANGVAVSRDQKSLYVNEMVGNAILKFSIEADGTLSHRSNFVLLNLLVPNKTENWWAGPDSLKIDSQGALYVAQFYGGRILKISPDGKLLHIFNIVAGNGTTNVAFGPGENDLYVSVVTNADDVTGEAKGSIVRIPNVR
jgi:gluconolactonase